MQRPKRRQYQHTKSRYRVKNWGEYEAGLRRRGDLTVWLSDEALDATCIIMNKFLWALSARTADL